MEEACVINWSVVMSFGQNLPNLSELCGFLFRNLKFFMTELGWAYRKVVRLLQHSMHSRLCS